MEALDLERIGGQRGFDAIVDEVLRAGELALRIQGRAAAHMTRKPDRSPVTEADEAVEKQLRRYLESRFPDASFLGEESGASDRGGPMRWVLDPIDGTRAFIRNLDTWSVLLALELHGEPVLGVALMPARRDLYVAAKGHGAYVNGRRCALSQVASLGDAMVMHGATAQFTSAGKGELLLALGRETYSQRSLADFANYAALLEGKADAVVETSIQAYDIAPAAVLVREAGGRFTDLAGDETIHSGSALASNGRVHDALLALTAG